MSRAERLDELLDQAQRALSRRQRLISAGEDPAGVDEILDDLYRDLGRTLIAAVGSGEVELLHHPGRQPGPQRPLPAGTDPSEAVTAVPAPSRAGRPSSAPPPPLPPHVLSVFPGLDALDLDDSTPVLPPEREFTAEEPADYLVATIDEMSEVAGSPGSPFAQIRAPRAPVWRDRLVELLGLLSLPASFADPSELAVESSRVQWATGELAALLSGMPREIRTSFVALLSARAQILRSRLDIDVGPRLSLDRLQRYRLESRLPAVAGLKPTPAPEGESWEGDARRWWALLGGGEP